MIVWMYYETDGDSGYYRIRLFDTEEKAKTFQKEHGTAYGHVKHMMVH
jgi:hypothetical protein